MKLTFKDTKSTAQILIVSSDTELTDKLENHLNRENVVVYRADNIDDTLNILEQKKIDLTITDSRTDCETALDIINIIRQSFPTTASLMLIPPDQPELVEKAYESGTLDAVAATISAKQLMLKIKMALNHCNMKQELILYRQQVAMSYGFDNIIGESKAITKIKETAGRIAPTDIAILITGATGTGKELLARTIHHHSNRRHQPLVVIDCSTIPAPLMDEELFGNRQKSPSGEFTKTGLIEKAEGGTLYFDNIEELPINVQTRLLRLFQYGEITPLGASEPIKINVRFIASSSCDLNLLVMEERFREDLLNHINVISLHLPKLKERLEDIEPLSKYFLQKISQETNQPGLTLNHQVLDRLHHYGWPGNIRELENSLKRAATLCRNNNIEIEDIILLTTSPDKHKDTPAKHESDKLESGLLSDSQRSIIAHALEDNNWNFTQTAQKLGIGRTTLWRKVKKYNLRSENTKKSEKV